MSATDPSASQPVDDSSGAGSGLFDQDDMPMFSTLVFALTSLLITAVVIVYGVFQFQSTASFIIRITGAGSAKISQIANTIVTQARAVVEASLPAIEQTAESVGFAIQNGLQSALNSIQSIGTSIIDLIGDIFTEIFSLFQEYGQQATSTFLLTILPTVRQVAVDLGFVLDTFTVIKTAWQSLASIITTIINDFGPFV